MDTEQDDVALGNDFREALRSLPVPVRQYIQQKKYSVAAQAISNRYGLHIDQGGVLERELLLLLLGTEDPAEFAATLQADSGLSVETIKSIVTDLNRDVLTPLQNEVRRAGQATPQPQPPKPAMPMQQRPQQPVQQMPQRPLPQPAVQPAPQPKPSYAPANLPGAPRFNQMLEDHEEPHINIGPRPTVPAPQPVAQPKLVWQGPAVQTPPAMPQPSRPVVPAPPPAPAPAPVRPAAPPITPAPKDENVVIKDYGSDPYREPFQI